MATTATTLIPDRKVTLLGALAAVNDNVVFGVPERSNAYRGILTLAAAGGGVTGPTYVLVGSIDNGATWFTVPAISTGALTAAALSGDTAVTAVEQYNISGLAGVLFKFALTAGTGITSMNVYGWVG